MATYLGSKCKLESVECPYCEDICWHISLLMRVLEAVGGCWPTLPLAISICRVAVDVVWVSSRNSVWPTLKKHFSSLWHVLSLVSPRTICCHNFIYSHKKGLLDFLRRRLLSGLRFGARHLWFRLNVLGLEIATDKRRLQQAQWD